MASWALATPQPTEQQQWLQQVWWCMTMPDSFSLMNGWGTGGGGYNAPTASTLTKGCDLGGVGGNALVALGLRKGWCMGGCSGNVSKSFFLLMVMALTVVVVSWQLWIRHMAGWLQYLDGEAIAAALVVAIIIVATDPPMMMSGSEHMTIDIGSAATHV